MGLPVIDIGNNPIARRGIGLAVGIAVFALILILINAITGNPPFPVEIKNAIDLIFETLYQWDFLLPISILVNGAILIIGMEISFLFIKIIIWLWGLFGQKSD